MHQKQPIAEFPPVRSDQINFLDITNDGLRADVAPNTKTIDFWANIEKVGLSN